MVKKILDDNQLTAFRNAMKDVIPIKIKKDRVVKISKKPLPKKRSPNSHNTYLENLEISSILPPGNVKSEDFLKYKQPSVSNQLLNALVKGEYYTEACLDLHKLTVHEAHREVIGFLTKCNQLQLQVATIIHGKAKDDGYPILKNSINHWLREMQIVLAFCSALPKHGGTGAIYIFLKSTK